MFDILFMANNRPEFTDASMSALRRNTDWSLVNSLYMYIDSCGVGEGYFNAGSKTFRVISEFGGPVGVMVDFLKRNEDSKAEWFVKVDNDVIMCPGWLQALYNRTHLFGSFADLVGIEARFGESMEGMLPVTPEFNKDYIRTLKSAQFIGGVGAMRYSAFRKFPDLQEAGKYFGFAQWQTRHPEITKAWIDPPLPTFLLDHLPFEPWRSLSKRYVVEGIQRRQWGEYTEEYAKLWEWWEPDWKEKR